MTSPATEHCTDCGMTLIELMVALAIGMALMLGAMTVFTESRATFRVTEAIARLQENGRFALDTLEADVRSAQHWGLTARTEAIRGRASEQPIATAGALSACGATWVIDLDAAVEVANNAYDWRCTASNAAAGSDTLVVRRAADEALAPAQVNRATPGTLFVQSRRGGADGQLFAGPTPEDFEAATDELRQLLVNGYYVSSRSSTFGASVPSLRMKTLVSGGSIEDHEVLAGVEDLQVELGIDTDTERSAERGAIDRYVAPNDPLLDSSIVRAVRLWLRLRAERPEAGFIDATSYDYADQSVTYNDSFRRIVVSRTIHLRNASP